MPAENTETIVNSSPIIPPDSPKPNIIVDSSNLMDLVSLNEIDK